MKKLKIFFFSTVVILTCGLNIQATVIDWVTVGDPGNQPDDTGFGSVNYIYQMGKYEITNSQYCDFLNSVAKEDTHRLYSTYMSEGYGGIIREGTPGNYTYSIRTGRGNMPVNYVTFYDAYRFANWLHNDQPIGSQDETTTEDGSYDMSSLAPDYTRKSGATVVIPNEDEWYKAAYYKGGDIDVGYWDYPTQSDMAPTAQLPSDGVFNSANYDWAVGDLTDVGSYYESASAYGTFDQGGNVWEYHEGYVRTPQLRGIRGTALHYVHGLRADERSDMHGESFVVGFRVAKVSEPQLNMIPVACIVGGDRTVEVGSDCEARVILDGTCSSDADSTPGTNDDINDFDWYEVIDVCDPNSDIFLGSGEIIECNLPLGEHTIVLEVTDKACAFDVNEVTITVEDTTPPEFSLTVEPSVLWPANHKMVEITPSWEVSDNCDEWPEVMLVSITINEDEATADDIQIGDGGIWLRAERSGRGSGRVYTITYQAVDDSGNVTVQEATVTVPHDRHRSK